jgi:hypothetical protein
MQDNDEFEEEINPDEIVSPFEPKDIDIATEQNSLSTIIGMIEDDVIKLTTDFQRKANLWDETKMSKLIESILFRLPLPAFYFDASDNDRWLIVDGLQRLSTFKKFVIDNKLVLKNLIILKELNGKTYEKLEPVLKRRIARYQITTHLIKPGTPKKVKSDVFRRINTGGLTLSRQEIRHSLNQGKPSDYLKRLVEDKRFTDIIRLDDKRMQARELILRYLAFSIKNYQEYNGPNFTVFLDDAMESLDNIKDIELEKLENQLWKALDTCQKIFGKKIFTKPNSSKQNNALFEVWTVLIGKLNNNEIKKILLSKRRVARHFRSCFKEDDFSNSISRSTLSKNRVIKRFETIENLIKKYIYDH